MVRSSMLRPRLLGAYVLLFMMVADRAAAQTAAPSSTPANAVGPVRIHTVGLRHAPMVPSPISIGRDSTPAASDVLSRAAVPVASPAPVPRAQNRADLALMAVGAAGLLVGALVGGDAGTVIAVGGGVVGLIGVYRFVR